jgi:hypothetical protein
MKKETLEEAAKESFNQHHIGQHDLARDIYEDGFINGAKWQAERMYEIMNAYADDVMGGCILRAKEWFEQSKNK